MVNLRLSWWKVLGWIFGLFSYVDIFDVDFFLSNELINISNCTGNSYFITCCCKRFSRNSNPLFQGHWLLHFKMGYTMPEVPDIGGFCFPYLGLYCHIFSCDVLDPISFGLEILVVFFLLWPAADIHVSYSLHLFSM